MIACSAIMDELLDVHSNEYENRVDWAMALSLPYIIIRRVQRDAPDPRPPAYKSTFSTQYAPEPLEPYDCAIMK